MIIYIEEEFRQYIEFELFKWKIKKDTPKHIVKELEEMLKYLHKDK